MEVQSDNENDYSEIAADPEVDWSSGCESLIPAKSKLRYENTYNIFKKWTDEKNAVINEKTLVAYFIERSNHLKSAASLWAEYSMLKATIKLNNGIDISKFSKLVAFLKKKNIGYQPKKSKCFTKEEMNRFLVEAPDEIFLMMKVAMVMGVAGACRRNELTNLTTEDIEDHGSFIIVTLPGTKTNVPRTFAVTNQMNDEVPFLEIFRKYLQLRPEKANSSRLFYAMRNGKCVNQVVGLNTMGQIPSRIAEYLQLKDPRAYTGHAFRRTSTTLQSKTTGVDIMSLIRHRVSKSNL